MTSLPKLNTNTAHLTHDATTALGHLLHSQSCPLYTAGRSLLPLLTRYSHRETNDSPTKKPRLASATPALSHRDKHFAVSPHNASLLLKWRARLIEYLFDLGDSLGVERNTVVSGVGYLDVYMMFCLFPERLERRMEVGRFDLEKDGGDGDLDIDENEEIGSISRHVYCLAGTTCFLLACKLYQPSSTVLTLSKASKITNFDVDELTCMELAILKSLRFHLNPCTPAKFLNEMMVLLLDHPESYCDGIDSHSNSQKLVKRSKCGLGTFQSLQWFPQTETQVQIIKYAHYMTHLVTYNDYVEAVSAPPSKVALAAILEGTKEYCRGADQIVFQQRLLALSNTDCIGRAFEVDDQVEKVRKCMRDMLHWNGYREELLRDGGGGSSPVTVLDFEKEVEEKKELVSKKQDDDDAFKNEGALSPLESEKCTMSSLSLHSMDTAIHPTKNDKDKNDIVAATLSNANHSDGEDSDAPGEGLVWEPLPEPRPLDMSKRSSCFVPLDIFGYGKAMITGRRVSTNL